MSILLIKNRKYIIILPILSILGISYKLAGTIIAEIGNISRFDFPSKLLAFAGLDPSMYISLENSFQLILSW